LTIIQTVMEVNSARSEFLVEQWKFGWMRYPFIPICNVSYYMWTFSECIRARPSDAAVCF